MPGLSSESKRDFREGAVSLMLCNAGDYISGMFLQLFHPIISRAPVILALLPAASDARGDVYSSYGSRLGTLLHLGLFWNRYRRELEALAVLIIVVNTWIGFLVAFFSVLTSTNLSILDTLFLALLSAFTSAILMVPATTLLAVRSFERGLDPDNLVAPIATLFGDLITIPSLVLSYKVSSYIPSWTKTVFILALAVLAIAFIARIYVLKTRGDTGYTRALRIIRENASVIMISTLLSSLAGVFLLDNMTRLLAWPGVLAVVPAFLEDGGAIATRFSSRLATKLHLGSVKPGSWPSGWAAEQFIVNILHAIIIFASLGVFGALMAIFTGALITWATRVFIAVVLAGMMLATIMSIISYYLAVKAFQYGLDPDNLLAPLLTSLADIIGVVSLVAFVMIIA